MKNSKYVLGFTLLDILSIHWEGEEPYIFWGH